MSLHRVVVDYKNVPPSPKGQGNPSECQRFLVHYDACRGVDVPYL